MFDQILDLVGQPPGSLVYHFIILFAVEAAFAISIGQWMRERDTGTFRLALGIFVVFCARVAVLIASLAAWQGYLPRNILLPPVERAVDTLSILGLAWVFITMDEPGILRRNFMPDVVSVLLAGLVLIGFGGSYYYWSSAAQTGVLFNGLWLDIAWSAAQIAIVAVGLLWMLTRVRYVYDPFLKGLMLLILGAAAALHLVRPVLGDIAGAMRVAQIVVMPMLAAVAYRHVVEQLLHWDEFEPSRLTESPASALAPALPAPDTAAEPAESIPEADDLTVRASPEVAPPPDAIEETVQAPPPAPVLESRPGRFESGPVLFEVIDAIGGLLNTLEPMEVVQEAPRVVATALRADIGVLAIVDEDVQQAAILGGYDNISQTALRKGMLDLANHPTVVNALGRLRQMRLTTQRNARELRDLYQQLGITHEGPAYIQPLVNGEERIGVLIAGSPYSERQFSNEERNLLDRLAPLVTAALLNSETYKEAREQADRLSAQEGDRVAQLADELTARTVELNTAERKIEEMKSYIRDVHRQLEEIPQQQRAAQQQAESLVAEINRLREAADKAQQENELLRRSAERVEELEREVSLLRQKPPVPGETLTTDAILQQLEEERRVLQGEIVSLRARLAQSIVVQQEVAFLQEQLASKAREAIMLQTRLTESQAVAEALREQVSSGLGSTRELEILQTRVAAQAAQIADLKTQLVEAQALAERDPDSLRAQQEADRIDREAMAQLEAQLAERAALVEALEAQLSEKARAIVALQAHMAEVNASLRNLEEQLTHKTDEAAALQLSLSEAHRQAQQRIAALEAHLEQEGGDEREVDRARAEVLEAELAEKVAAITTLEEQLERTRQSMSELEKQLAVTNQAVGAAISDARQIDQHDEVIASIAQELRTPMSSILGYTELLLRESAGILGQLQRQFLLRVKANIERMGALLDDLIRITTLDTEGLQIAPEKVDIFYAIEEVVMNLTSQFTEKALTLRLTAPPELPPITADREALVEMLQHLLANAALASPLEGEIELRVAVTEGILSDNGDEADLAACLQFSIDDSGGGIAPEDIERVFTRKYRADNPLIEGLGDTGVGLSLAKALVEAHGGRIWLDSQPGSGTTFHILLPLQPTRGETLS